ncbi:CGNR zinc finger domain-containing protein [Streptomyces sp. NBC_01799]|uniref:CGNR zinc finger domain-containing protein n=1 Tax=Streptomyces sp. NBC_01800 TaxID=2975945 RepID=UPI002DDC0119|nr:CGNR zinc finger domain-containing protein [Streptomyces sp. NBC_01800]WSA66183.1 CGNR zinc finger domain-containing protein [Streptomyces sp. NBC_01800]WSA74782.1 CGNR zinc finger domain-containing protein [Streptomyces sp. NBC_01799]
MAADREQQDALLELLNTTPVVNGVVQDQLADPEAAEAWQRARGGSGTADEHRHLVQARDALQEVVRGSRPATSLAPVLDGVTSRPQVSSAGVSWDLDARKERRMAVQAVMTWSALQKGMPGRLRPCANEECRRFLLDRSKTNKARWCSMAVCGNRMKARRHYQRTRNDAAE